MPFTIQDILTLKDGRRRVWGFLMVVSYTVFLVMKFLTLRSLPTESVGLFNAVFLPHASRSLGPIFERGAF